jgi:BlaI family penicillinase repressor
VPRKQDSSHRADDPSGGEPRRRPETQIHLSRRERQIMDVVYRLGRASAAEVTAHLPDPPSYSAVRALLRILEDKGHLRHTEEAATGKYVYAPIRPRDHAGRSALQRVVQTFFDNSAEKAVAALLDLADRDLSEQELERLAKLIEQARNDGR